jgi:hypothetical protein
MVVDPSRTGYLTAVDYWAIARAAPLPGSISPTLDRQYATCWGRRGEATDVVSDMPMGLI